ncbi:MAG: hypothetical protein ABI461_01400 [Polyangiaceae bacterium]
MKMGKILAVSAVSGIMLGVLAGCGTSAPPTPVDPAAAGGKASCSANGAAPSTAAPASTDGTKASCSGKGSCSGKAGDAPKAN